MSGKRYKRERAIISLTTWKARINEVGFTIYSLLRQCPGFHVVLVLSAEEFPRLEDDLPDDLVLMVRQSLFEILWIRNDLRPHNKYFYTMCKYRRVPIITVDDDRIPKNNIAEVLYNAYLKNPSVISAGRCHYIEVNKSGEVLPYSNWRWEHTSTTDPSFCLFATGVGGVLYPPNILRLNNTDICLIKDIITADDIYLKVKEVALGIKVQFVKNVRWFGVELGHGLCHINTVGPKLNDVYIEKWLSPLFKKIPYEYYS